MTRELETGRIESAPAANPERAAFLEGFPKRYLRTHSEAEIASHMALEAKVRDPKAPRGCVPISAPDKRSPADIDQSSRWAWREGNRRQLGR